MSHFQAILS